MAASGFSSTLVIYLFFLFSCSGDGLQVSLDLLQSISCRKRVASAQENLENHLCMQSCNSPTPSFRRLLVILQMRPSVQELLCMPYVSQYVHKYAEHIMQLPDHIGHARAPSLNLDQLPIIKQIR